MNPVLVETNPSPMKLEILGVEDWPILHQEVGQFAQTATQTETSFIISGEARLLVEGKEPVIVGESDLVTILPGTSCSWHITKAIKRHHSLG